MKPILLLISLFICGISNATNYYFSSSTGDDTRTAAQAQNPATPWQSISKLNSFFSTLAAGDSVLLKRGDVFYGSITINKSGTSTAFIKIGAYGTGSNPIVTGLTTVSAWRSLGSNLWESTNAVSALSTLKMVLINGVNTPMGRYPNISSTSVSPQQSIHPVPGNNGWLNYESHSGATQITDNELPASPNWTGAQAVIKTVNWVVDVATITNHTTHVINYSPTAVDGGSFSEGMDGMSYFIQNDIRTLDEQNEWYYNPSTKKLTIYSTSTPTSVQVATVQNLITGNNKNYISLSNLNLNGSNGDLITLPNNTTKWNLINCEISFAGRDGVFSNTASNMIISGCNIHDINNNGIMLRDQADNNTINDNKVTNIGIYAGMTDQSIYFSCEGIHCVGDNFTCTGNTVKNVGIDGIRFGGSNVLVNKNFITNHCIVKTDAGGIYTWGVNGDVTYTNQVIEDNIIVNGSDLGVIGTWLEQEELSVNGIYLDGKSQNVIVRRNHISHVNASGIYMNTPMNVTVRDNNIYDCRYASIHTNNNDGSILNLVVKNNICVARSLNTAPTGSNQRCFYYLSIHDDITSSLVADSNYFARPMDDGTANPISKVVYNGSYTGPGEPGAQTKYTLAAWKTAFTAIDQHSKKSPKIVSTVYEMRFEYNATASPKTVSLGAIYMDMKGVIYAGTITIPAFSSVLLLKNDAINIPPIADAGTDQTVIIPLISIPILGSGTDYDGTIASYAWTKISGPTTGTLTSLISAVTFATGLVQGIYKFELKVTDNKGAVGRDTVSINFGGVVVPVTLIDFSGVGRSGKSYLQWSTATEINSSHFEIERSTDGTNFQTIGVVTANGNTATRTDYQFTDNFPETGINYYRLKIVDRDGQYEYSRVISITFKDLGNGSIEIKSGIINNKMLQLNISSTKQQTAMLSLYDAAGRMVFTSNITLQKGINNISKEVILSSAVYHCKLSNGQEAITQSLLGSH